MKKKNCWRYFSIYYGCHCPMAYFRCLHFSFLACIRILLKFVVAARHCENGYSIFFYLALFYHSSADHWPTKKKRLFMAASDSLYDKFFPNFLFRSLNLIRFQLDLFHFGDFLISFFTKYFRLSVNEFTTIPHFLFPFYHLFFFSLNNHFFCVPFVKFHWHRYTKIWLDQGWFTI